MSEILQTRANMPDAIPEGTDNIDLETEVSGYLGWTNVGVRLATLEGGSRDYLSGTTPCGIPNVEVPHFASDLNDMNRAEEKLTGRQHSRFRRHLSLVCHNGQIGRINSRKITSASARQRAEAFAMVFREEARWKRTKSQILE